MMQCDADFAVCCSVSQCVAVCSCRVSSLMPLPSLRYVPHTWMSKYVCVCIHIYVYTCTCMDRMHIFRIDTFCRCGKLGRVKTRLFYCSGLLVLVRLCVCVGTCVRVCFSALVCWCWCVCVSLSVSVSVSMSRSTFVSVSVSVSVSVFVLVLWFAGVGAFVFLRLCLSLYMCLC